MQPSATRPSRYSLLTVAQLVVGVSGVALSLLNGGLLIIVTRLSKSQQADFPVGFSLNPLALWILGFLTLLCGLSIWVALRKLKGAKPPELPSRWLSRAPLLMILWVPLLLLASWMLSKNLVPALLPLVYLLLVVIPLVSVLAASLHGIQHGTLSHFWGVLTGTLYVTMPLIIVIEGIFLIGAIVMAGLNIAASPELTQFFSSFSQMDVVSQEQLDQVYTQFSPYLSSPGVIYGVLFGFCLLIPALEELLKPLMLWAFARRKLTPAQGFGIGLICGAGFALLESTYALQAAAATDITVLALGRMGTGLLHAFNTGLMGWAIVSTWRDGKAMRAALVYLGVVLLHGLWNFFAILLGISALPVSFPAAVSSLSSAAPWMLGLLVVWMLTILWVLRRKLLSEVPSSLPPLVTDSEISALP